MTNHNITPEELTYIDRYLQNELTEEEVLEFRSRMENEPAFTEKVNQVRLMLLGIAETGLEEKMNEFHQKIPQAPEKGRVFRLRYLAIAASVAVILSLTVWLFLLQNNRDDLYSEYFTPDPGLMTAMGSTDNYDFEKAMVSYRSGEYREAIDSWKVQLQSNPASDTICYFLGAAYQANDNIDSAKIYLSKIAAQTASSFYKDANWYMALLCLQTDQRSEALSHLKLSAHSKTAELIKRLEK